MSAIPLVFNAPKANINVNSVRPINANPNKMNMGGAAGMLGGGGLSNEAQLRQEINTSIVALKREAFSLETLIAQAAQILQDVNKRLSELEEKQGDYVKKADATVASVGGDGKYISAISETDGKINATATDLGNMVPVNSVTSGNMHSVTSNAVEQAIENKKIFSSTGFGTQLTIYRNANGGSADIKYSNKSSVLGFMGIGPDEMPEFVDKTESLVKRIPYIDYANISGTTDNNGLLDLGSLGNYIPLIVYDNYPYMTQFFNGSSSAFHPYVRITNYDGTPRANSQVTLRLIVLPL